MEVLLKTLYFLCLSSAAITLQPSPALNDNSGNDLEGRSDAAHTDLLDKINPFFSVSASRKQCFCIPYNANSQPVINYVNIINEEVERKVVYLYISNGIVKVYIPNMNKQKLFPEMNFDASEGDILKQVSSETIVDLIESHVFKPQHLLIREDTVEQIEPIHVEINKPRPININTDSEDLFINNIDHIPLISSNDNGLPEYIDEQIIYGEDILKPSVQSESIGNLDFNQITNLPDPNQLQEVTSISLLEQQAIINNQATAIDNENVNIIPNLEDSDNLQENPSILLPNIQSSVSQVNEHNLNNIPNPEGYDQFQEVFSLLPSEASSYSKPSLQQSLYSFKPMSNDYITFKDWFNLQLKLVVFFNLETQSKIIEFRERIKKVLINNGMNFSAKGIVTDSNGQLVRLNNIKLRPILIGSQVDPQNFLDHEINSPKNRVSYIQVVEIILVTPPKLLGTLLMGRVYLPRNILGELKVNLWNDYKIPKFQVGCITCKQKISKNPYSYPYSIIDGVHHIPSLPYGQYHKLPLRRNFNTEQQYLINDLPFERHSTVSEEPQKRINDNMNRNGVGGIFEDLLGTVRTASSEIANPTRRLLGGTLPNGAKPGPQKHPNDVLPGFRIIGGNAATSSGTPLVNKGRSGLEVPSHII